MSEIDDKGNMLSTFTDVKSPRHLSTDMTGHVLVTDYGSHSTAGQSTTARTCPHWQKLSSQVVVPIPTTSKWTHITTLRSTQQQQWVGVAWRDHTVESAMID